MPHSFNHSSSVTVNLVKAHGVLDTSYHRVRSLNNNNYKSLSGVYSMFLTLPHTCLAQLFLVSSATVIKPSLLFLLIFSHFTRVTWEQYPLITKQCRELRLTNQVRGVHVWGNGGRGLAEQVLLQSEDCMKGPESEGVIPVTHQTDVGLESVYEGMPACYHIAHRNTHRHTKTI